MLMIGSNGLAAPPPSLLLLLLLLPSLLRTGKGLRQHRNWSWVLQIRMEPRKRALLPWIRIGTKKTPPSLTRWEQLLQKRKKKSKRESERKS